MPWPVLVEVDLLLRARGHAPAALAFGQALLLGVHSLEAPRDTDLALMMDLADRYPDSGVDIPDLSVMALAARHEAAILTWDFRHFRSVVLDRGHHWRLLVDEHELPTV